MRRRGVPVLPAARCVSLMVQVGAGPEAGRAVSVPVGNATPAMFRAGEAVRVGRVQDPSGGAATYVFDDVVRGAPLGWLAAAFAVVMVAVARWRGLAALACLGLTYLVLVAFVLPALLDGRSATMVALVGAAAILFVVLYLAHGFSARTSAALLGTLLSLALTGLLAWVAVGATRLTGLSEETVPYLQAAASRVSISGLLLCGLIIGALGVLNDATVTQASAVLDLHDAHPGSPPIGLYRSAMRIGRDHIASTIYTLVVAYAGSALPALLLFSISGRSAHDVLTGDEIAGEIVRGLIGGIGIAASVPITTAVAVSVVTAGQSAGPEAQAGGSPPGKSRGRAEVGCRVTLGRK
ncbi:MAG TPA: YibE/F family protein [Mycobacteriales bacterium]|nr:YibE/F family protein [Mycobacteriales bacterium]